MDVGTGKGNKEAVETQLSFRLPEREGKRRLGGSLSSRLSGWGGLFQIEGRFSYGFLRVDVTSSPERGRGGNC